MNATQHPHHATEVAARTIEWISIVGLLALVVWGFTRTLPIVGSAAGLSPVEGAVIEMGNRVLHGENPYPNPMTDRAVAFLYPPLAPVLLAAVYQISPSLTAPRALSALAVFATAAVLFVYLRQRNHWRAGAIAALAWLALGNSFCGYFFLARVDAIANLLLLTALIVGTRAAAAGTTRAIAVAAALTTAAVLCKQTAVAVAVGVTLGIARNGGARAAGRYVLILTALVGSALLTLHVLSSGWSTKFLLMAGGHPFQAQELAAAADRLFSVDALLLLTVAVLGIRGKELAWSVTTLLTLALAVLTTSKWGGLTTALAPVFLLWLGMTGVGRQGGRAADATLGMVAAFCALFLPLAIWSVKLPVWGVADTGPLVAERAALTTPTVATIRAIPGAILVNGYQEYALLARRRVDDDLHAGLECDLAGYAALTRIHGKIERREYALFAGSIEDLTARAAEVREKRPETATRLEACARALAERYQEYPAPQGLTRVYVPRP